MKGVSFVTNAHNRKKAVMIDLKTIEEHAEEVEDFLLSLIAESRLDEPHVPLDAVIGKLKKSRQVIDACKRVQG